MTQRERKVMECALRTLELGMGNSKLRAINELRACLAEPDHTEDMRAMVRREWVGLTDEEYELMAEKRVTNYFFNTLDYAHDIEAKLKEKNT